MVAGVIAGFCAGVLATMLAFGTGDAKPELPLSVSDILVREAPCVLQYQVGLMKHEELGQLATTRDEAVKAGLVRVTYAHRPAPDGTGEYVAISGFICPTETP